MSNIVLLAPFGQLGFQLARSLASLGTLHCISRAEIDFANIATLCERIAQIKPAIIVNAAAWTAVDKAETEYDATYTLNCHLPSALASLAQQLNAWLVHYSSDYVYRGDGNLPWQEDDTPSPLSVYGSSKLAGDEAVVQRCEKHLIFRTSWVYCARGNNFMRTMLQLAQQRETLSVVSDQIGAPTPARLLADVTALALHHVLSFIALPDQGKTLSGIYHVAPQGETSWYGFAQAIFDLARSKITLRLDNSQFKAITTQEYPTPAARPSNSRLSTNKLQKTFSLTMPHWQSQLELTFAEWLSYQPKQ